MLERSGNWGAGPLSRCRICQGSRGKGKNRDKLINFIDRVSTSDFI